jgi:hypothetical protein
MELSRKLFSAVLLVLLLLVATGTLHHPRLYTTAIYTSSDELNLL